MRNTRYLGHLRVAIREGGCPTRTSKGSGIDSESKGNDCHLIFKPIVNHHPPPLAWMDQSPLNFKGLHHDMPRHSEKHLPKFDLEKGTSVDDHISNLYLSLQIMKVQFDDIACRLFPHTLENKVVTSYGCYLSPPSEYGTSSKNPLWTNFYNIRCLPCSSLSSTHWNAIRRRR